MRTDLNRRTLALVSLAAVCTAGPIGWAHAMDTPFQWTKRERPRVRLGRLVVAVRLGEEKLTADEQRQFDAIRGRAVMAE